MTRILLLLLLVVVIPGAVYWATNGMDDAGATVEHFASGLSDLRGAQPVRPATKPKADPPKTDDDPSKDDPSKDDDQPTNKDGDPKSPDQTPPERHDQDPEDADPKKTDPDKLFARGEFDAAATAYTGRDARRRGLSLLGGAFLKAFPEQTPRGEYYVITTNFGDTYEGFLRDSVGLTKLTGFNGKSQTVPENAIRSRRPLTLAQARERVLERARALVENKKTTGARVFAHIQEACRANRPDAVAVLLEPALALDEQKPYFLSSVRQRVPSSHQGALYRAFLDCELPALEDTDTVSNTTKRVSPLKKIGEGTRKKPVKEPKTTNAKVLALLRKAAPLKTDGIAEYRAIVRKGVDNSTVREVSSAISKLQKALDLYEKAVILEDSDEIYAILRPLSRYTFQLRFWKQQLEGR